MTVCKPACRTARCRASGKTWRPAREACAAAAAWSCSCSWGGERRSGAGGERGGLLCRMTSDLPPSSRWSRPESGDEGTSEGLSERCLLFEHFFTCASIKLHFE